jgi:hypothetical protein
MPRRKVFGVCHICGVNAKLSFEHVPPERAFNSHPIVRRPFLEMLNREPGDPLPKGQIEQRGLGGYTLCERCNNLTGHWYGPAFVDWCHQGMQIILRAEGKPSLVYLHHVFPLRIIKQIVTMFFSACRGGLRETAPELEAFVLNPERRYLPPQFDIFTYYNLEGTFRYWGVTSVLRLNTGLISAFAEITFPPFGYVMTFDSAPPDDRLFSLSHFARYDYDEFRTFEMKLPVLPTILSIPGDYRTRDEIEIDRTRACLQREANASNFDDAA